MNHCKDCRFWSGEYSPNDTFGICHAMFTFRACISGAVYDGVRFNSSPNGTAILPSGLLPSSLMQYSPDRPLFPRDFGCVHFEAKEEA